MGEDIMSMAVNGMLTADHDLSYPDPGPLPSITTVFNAYT